MSNRTEKKKLAKEYSENNTAISSTDGENKQIKIS